MNATLVSFSLCFRLLNSFCIETVIPKKTGSVMMVIAGSMKGEFGRIIDRDDKKETVHLELFNLRRDVERFKFDNVCEFNALAADFED